MCTLACVSLGWARTSTQVPILHNASDERPPGDPKRAGAHSHSQAPARPLTGANEAPNRRHQALKEAPEKLLKGRQRGPRRGAKRLSRLSRRRQRGPQRGKALREAPAGLSKRTSEALKDAAARLSTRHQRGSERGASALQEAPAPVCSIPQAERTHLRADPSDGQNHLPYLPENCAGTSGALK